MRRAFVPLAALASLILPVSAFADNIAACEIVVMVEVEDGAGTLASFRDAADFIAAAYDETRDPVTEVSGHPINGLMCERSNPVPSVSDYPLIATGVPFVLSTNFDSPDAPTINIALNEKGQAIPLMAVGLKPDQIRALEKFLADFPPVEMPPADTDDVDEEESEDAVDGLDEEAEDASSEE